MTKTIEEAAKQFTDELFAGDDLTDFDTQTEKNDAYVMCMAFGNHLMSLPLSQRLTDEERDWIKKIHEDELEFAQFYQRKANSCCNQQCKIDYEVARDIAKSRAGLVEAIFGKELFGEGEG